MTRGHSKQKSSAKAALSGQRGPRRGRKPVTLQQLLKLSTSDMTEMAANVKAMEAPISALKERVNRLLTQLTPREREVLNQRFGSKP